MCAPLGPNIHAGDENMRLTTPRVAPAASESWTEEQREIAEPILARGPLLNIFRTLLTHSAAAKAFLGWGRYILGRNNTLPPREREIVILRTGFLCRSGYEWTQHLPIARRAGLTDEEIARVKLGAAAPGWSNADAALLRATDDLHREQFITEAVWAELAQYFQERQRMDMVFTAGQYTQVSMLLNSFGVQLDEGQVLDPDLRGY
jgi:4-carboxymuconolactone decarboxylase